MRTSGVRYEDLAAVAVTSGPGLAYCLEIGIKKAKEIAATYNLPLIGVNHMEVLAISLSLLLSTLLNPSSLSPLPPLLSLPYFLLLSSFYHMLISILSFRDMR
jgi:hypothetical protein